MAYDPRELEKMRADCQKVTDRPFTHFLCPITLEDSFGEHGLADGHILNKSFKSASTQTVIQRADVDNYFGGKLEGTLNEFIHAVFQTPDAHEILERRGKPALIQGNGKRGRLYRSKSKPNPRDTPIHVNTSQGPKTFYTDVAPNEIALVPQIELTKQYSGCAAMGAMLKSAYLFKFKLMGYRWVFSPDGDLVRRVLNRFFQEKGNAETAENYFGSFRSAICPALDASPNAPDSIKDSLFIFHSVPSNPSSAGSVTFAQSCIFSVNGKTIFVTLPFFELRSNQAARPEEQWISTIEIYERLLANRGMPHQEEFGRYQDGRWVIIGPKPASQFVGKMNDTVTM